MTTVDLTPEEKSYLLERLQADSDEFKELLSQAGRSGNPGEMLRLSDKVFLVSALRNKIQNSK